MGDIKQQKKTGPTLAFRCHNCGGDTIEKRDAGTGQVYKRCVGTCRRAFTIKRV